MANKKPLRYQFTYNGKRYSVTGKTQKELMDRVQKKMSAVKKQYAVTQNMSVNAWKREWLNTYKKGKVTDKTFEDYQGILKAVDLSMPVKNVRPVHLQNILNQHASYSYSYLQKLNLLMNQLFLSAKKNGLCISNPAEDLSVPKGKAGTHRAITQEEREMVMEACNTSRARVYVLLMLLCGLRPSETSVVQGMDIDINNMRIHVRGTKSKSADRYVPLPFALLKDLRKLKDKDYAVTDSKGNPTSKSNRHSLWITFRHDMEAFGTVADDFTAYCLRHTYATDLEAAGVPINVARDLLGHSDISVTSKIYTHRSEEAFLSASEKIGKYQAKKNIALAK